MSAQVEDSSPPGQYYCPQCEKNFALGERCPTDGTKLVRIGAVLDPLLGRDIEGRYTITEKLGQGGMGAVYRAAQHGLQREVAIKVISSHLVSDPDVVKRFLREAKLASRLSHPNAVAVLEFGQTDDGLFYLVMELVSGRTLDAVIKSEKQLRADRVIRIGTQVCDALEGAHALSIVHRDLKPANIMLLARGRDLVKVLDFGLAKVVGPDQTTATMTNAGALLGTPAFMPPELALGQPCDGRADLYSLGVVLYLAGSGRLPFQSESPHELIAMHGTEAAPPMTGVPPALAAVIDRMLQKDPSARYQSAAENREALEAALEGRFTPVPGTFSTLSPGATIAPGATVPDVGPFPARSADFAALDGIDVEGDTVAAAVSKSMLDSSPARPALRRTSRVMPALAALVVASGLGVGGYWMFLRQDEAATPAPAAGSAQANPATTDPPKQDPPKTDPPKIDPEPAKDTAKAPPKSDPIATDPMPPPKDDDATKKHPKVDKKKVVKSTKSGTGVKPPKDTTKDVAKEPLKDTTKDVVKAPPKDAVKDVPHEPVKDATVKDPPKDTTQKAGAGSGSGKMPF